MSANATFDIGSNTLTYTGNAIDVGANTLTIDGRRAYLLSPMKKNNSIFVLVKNYKNLWADHKRNDLEYIEFIKEDGFLFPKNINIMFKGGVFSLNRVWF